MPTNVNEKIKKLTAAQRKKVETRAAQLIAEEMTLRELRQARKLTQVRMAKTLGITQDSVSRLEKRSDLLLSTLRKTVEAMGGTYLLSLSSLTVRQLFCPALLETISSLSGPRDEHRLVSVAGKITFKPPDLKFPAFSQ